jgi:hypothetical protein
MSGMASSYALVDQATVDGLLDVSAVGKEAGGGHGPASRVSLLIATCLFINYGALPCPLPRCPRVLFLC